MQSDDEITATQLAIVLNLCEISISLSTIKRSRQPLLSGSTYYCQLIHGHNKVKRLEWVKKCFENGDTFDDVIWSDEMPVQVDFHGKHQFLKADQPHKLSEFQSIL